jgi:hypothetical protein
MEEGIWPDHTKNVKSRTYIPTESKDSCSTHPYQKAALRIRDILVRIRMLIREAQKHQDRDLDHWYNTFTSLKIKSHEEVTKQ